MRKVAFILPLVFYGCGISRQAEEAQSFARCTFRFSGVERVVVGGVDVTNVKSLKDLSLKKMGKLIEAAAEKELPLQLTVSLEAFNPNDTKAALNALEWIALADEKEIARGKLETRVEVPVRGSAAFPVDVSTNLKRGGGSRDALLNLALNLGGQGDKPTDLLFKIKPTIDVGGIAVAYPGYLEIRREITAKDNKASNNKLVKPNP